MGGSHIFVCYDITDTTYENVSLTMQLISDLRHAGAEVVTDSDTVSNGAFVRFLNQILPQCQWLILVQTPQALQSLRVQTSVNMALHLVAQQQIRGVLRVTISSDDLQDEPFAWTTLHEFDARQDYARARDRVLLELGLLRIDDELIEMQPTLLLPVVTDVQGLEDSSENYEPLGGSDRPAGYLMCLDRPLHYRAAQRSSRCRDMVVFLKSMVTGFSVLSASVRRNAYEVFLRKPQVRDLMLLEPVSLLSLRETRQARLILSSFVLLITLLLIGVSIIVRGSTVDPNKNTPPLVKPSPTVRPKVVHTVVATRDAKHLVGKIQVSDAVNWRMVTGDESGNNFKASLVTFYEYPLPSEGRKKYLMGLVVIQFSLTSKKGTW